MLVRPKYVGFVCMCMILVVYYLSFSGYEEESFTYIKQHSSIDADMYIPRQSKNLDYLINTTNCQIPDIDPFNEEVLQFVHKENYTRCTELPLLSYIDKSDGIITLNINTSLVPLYSKYHITCCYAVIYRPEKEDNKAKYTSCKAFESSVVITHPFIKVVCRNTFYIKVYVNVHAVSLLTSQQQKQREENRSVFSVLLVGIDSVSKQNLIRTMPKSYKYLEEHFINLRGYNKVGENTFPNLMAMLTGQNDAQLEETCKWTEVMDKCDFIWKTFKQLGFVTAYAEDECFLTTFNYLKLGFIDPPTDYYYRPYFISAEDLYAVKSKCHRQFCAGPETSGERMFNSVKDYSKTFNTVPSFGLFWMNSFSHDNINCPSAMDDTILQFLSDEAFISSLNKTLFIFFSDHGFRFGNIRYTNAGWMEDRLPFIYTFIPDSFKNSFPGEYKNFLVNSKRLTTAFDVYDTMQHILELSDLGHKFKKGLGCPTCHSLFEEVKEDRSCEEGNIPQHWCTCKGHHYISPLDSVVQRIAPFVIQELNIVIKDFLEGNRCVTYSLETVHSAGVTQVHKNRNNQSVIDYLLIIKTKPEAMFEVTVEASVDSEDDSFSILGDITRINRYADNSHCVNDGTLKKYCYCDDILSIFKSKLCQYFDRC